MKLTIPEIKQLVKELLTESEIRYLMEQEQKQKGFDPKQFKAAVMASKAGDKFTILMLKDVRKPIGVGRFKVAGPLVFKEGKRYRGVVGKDDDSMEWVEIGHEAIGPLEKTKLSKSEFIEEIVKQGAPCETINCDKSKFIRKGSASKTFNEFLESPSFKKDKEEEVKPEEATPEEAKPEEKKPQKRSKEKRIEAMRVASEKNDAKPEYHGRSDEFYSAAIDCKDKYEPGFKADEEGAYKKYKKCLAAAHKKYPKEAKPEEAKPEEAKPEEEKTEPSAEEAATRPHQKSEEELAKLRKGWELGVPPGEKRYKSPDFGEFKTPMHRWTPPTLPGMEGGGEDIPRVKVGGRVKHPPLGSPPSYDVLYSLVYKNPEAHKIVKTIEQKLEGKLPWGPRAAKGASTGEAEYGYRYLRAILERAGYLAHPSNHMSEWKYYGKRETPPKKPLAMPGEEIAQRKAPPKLPLVMPGEEKTASTVKNPPVKSHRVTGGQGYYQILRDLDLLKGLKRPQRRALIQKLKSAFGGRMITTKDVVHVDANGNFRVEGHGRQLEENKSFSSFPEYQNFFKSWSKYLNEE